jgi:replication-associated recombination protein RarA
MTDRKTDHNPSDWLSSDRPIEQREQDVLGRSRFSDAIARSIRGWLGHESIVIALYGAWGNGKTSIKNMVIECLTRKRESFSIVLPTLASVEEAVEVSTVSEVAHLF